MEKDNWILLDSAPQPEWNFAELLEKETDRKWKIRHIDSHFSDPGWKKKLKFFLFPMQLLLQRERVEVILSFQQFYGLLYGWYCRLLHLKKKNRLIVATFIYRPRTGIKGKFYYQFMKCMVNSGYIDKIICFSKTEPEYYQKLFHTEKNLFCYVPFAAADESKKVKTGVENQKSYILSVGKSNRDYDFLTEALQNTQYEVRILSDTWTEKEKHQNIRVYADVFGEKYLQMLAECWCVIVPLADIHISAGQFVFLQSMMFGKPVIVTESDTVHEYIENEKNGLIIPKEKQALLKALKRLEEDPALYQKLGKSGKIVYREKFSLQHMAEVIGKICCEDSKGGCK